MAQEVEGGPGSSVEVPPLPPDLVLEVRTTAGEPVPTRPPRGSHRYAVGAVSGEVRYVFVLDQPATVVVEATGGAGTRLALGRDALPLIGKPMLALTGAIFLLAGAPVLALVGLVLVLVGRR